MTGFTFSDMFREMAAIQHVSLRRLMRLGRAGREREEGGREGGREGGKVVSGHTRKWYLCYCL